MVVTTLHKGSQSVVRQRIGRTQAPGGWPEDESRRVMGIVNRVIHILKPKSSAEARRSRNRSGLMKKKRPYEPVSKSEPSSQPCHSPTLAVTPVTLHKVLTWLVNAADMMWANGGTFRRTRSWGQS